MKDTSRKYEVVLVGCSAGGMEALSQLLRGIKPEIDAAVAIVQHLGPSMDNYLVSHLRGQTPLPLHEATDKIPMEYGHVYVAPPNYHLLVEKDRTFSLSLEGRVNFARPSIDVLFESAARAFGEAVIAVILTGANRDGSEGCREVKERGGVVLVQDPETAEHRTMPDAAVRSIPHLVAALNDLAVEINRLTTKPTAGPRTH